MKNLFLKYQTALGTIFCLWLFLTIFKKLGFTFGVNLSVFFRIFLFLFIIWLVWITKIKWSEINAIIKRIWSEVKDKFIAETKKNQEEIIRFSPQLLTGKTGSSLSFFIAFIFSFFLLSWQLVKKIFKVYVFNRITFLVLVILGILLDIFVLKSSYDLVIIFLTVLWILSVYRYKFEGRISVGLALGFLILCPFLLIFKKELIAEKSAIWAYLFLVVGVVQLFIENFKKEKESVQKED